MVRTLCRSGGCFRRRSDEPEDRTVIRKLKSGVLDCIVQILSVLEAQRRAVQARNSMIALRNQRLQNRVDLHLALGGDFKTSAPEG